MNCIPLRWNYFSRECPLKGLSTQYYYNDYYYTTTITTPPGCVKKTSKLGQTLELLRDIPYSYYLKEPQTLQIIAI